MGLKSGWLKRVTRWSRRNGIAVLVAVFFIFLDANAWCEIQNVRSTDSENIPSFLHDIGNYKGSVLTADRKNRGFEKKYQEWQSLTPQEKDTMRHRMNQLNQMPLQDRQHFQRLFDKWQQLSSGERRQIERTLDNWDNLSPKERESIRKRFK